jgi:hypothetical protein
MPLALSTYGLQTSQPSSRLANGPTVPFQRRAGGATFMLLTGAL